MVDERKNSLRNPINWFPGHMAKAMRGVSQKIKVVDLVIEVRDARAPLASGNNKLDEMLGQKPRLIILNKSDLVSREDLSVWERWFATNGTPSLFVSAFDAKALSRILSQSREITSDKWRRYEEKGIVPPPLRVMIVGIPNTGKSTLINRLVSKKTAKTGNKPGVTRSEEWIVLKHKVELLDTPGIMPPKIADDEHGLWLCAVHAIKDEIVGKERVAKYVLRHMLNADAEIVRSRYRLGQAKNGDIESVLNQIGEELNFRGKGGEIDLAKVYDVILRDFRQGALGKICFERPPG